MPCSQIWTCLGRSPQRDTAPSTNLGWYRVCGLGGRQRTSRAERVQSHNGEARGYVWRPTRVRHLVGLDVDRKGVVVGDNVLVGDDMQFCERHVQAARADLMRVCAESRDELESLTEPRLALIAPVP